MMLLVIVPLVLFVPISAGVDGKTSEVKLSGDVTTTDEYVARSFNWIGDRFLGIVESFIPDERTGRSNSLTDRRRRKRIRLNRYVFPLIVGFLLMKSIILPLALKALAILSGKAVVLSIMSLILAAIVGLRSVGGGGGWSYAQNKVDAPLTKYRRKDILDHPESIDDDPYRYYPEHRRRRRK